MEEEQSRLTLSVRPRALERLSAMGSEFTLAPMTLRTPRGPLPALVCRLGAPKDAEGYTALTSGGITVHVPDDEAFIADRVVIDLIAAGNMIVPAALSAIIIPESDCSGGCAGCASAGLCGATDDSFE